MSAFGESILGQHLSLRFFDTRLVELKDRATVEADDMIVVIVRFLNTGLIKNDAGRVGEGFSKEPCLFEDVDGPVNSGRSDGGVLRLDPPDHLLRGLMASVSEDDLGDQITLLTLVEVF